LPEHWVFAGTHTPVQTPPTHAEATQGVPLPHWPAAVHVSTPLPEQRAAFGAQTPEQTPLTQA
jgi:hypothetical protein